MSIVFIQMCNFCKYKNEQQYEFANKLHCHKNICIGIILKHTEYKHRIFGLPCN